MAISDIQIEAQAYVDLVYIATHIDYEVALSYDERTGRFTVAFWLDGNREVFEDDDAPRAIAKACRWLQWTHEEPDR